MAMEHDEHWMVGRSRTMLSHNMPSETDEFRIQRYFPGLKNSIAKRPPKYSKRAERLKREARKRANKPFVLHPRLKKTGTTLMDRHFMAPANLTALSRIRKEIVIRPSVMRVLDPANVRPSVGIVSAGPEMIGKRVLLQGLKDRSLNGKEARIRKILKNGRIQLTMAGDRAVITYPENLKELKPFKNTNLSAARKTIASDYKYMSTPFDAETVEQRQARKQSKDSRVSANDFRYTNSTQAREKLKINYTVDSGEAATIKAERRFLNWQKEQLRQTIANSRQ